MELTSIKLPLPKLLVETQKNLSVTPEHQSYSNMMAVSEDSTKVQINDQQSVDNFSLATGISHKPGLELQPLNIYSASELNKNTIKLLTQPSIMQSSGHPDEKTGMSLL